MQNELGSLAYVLALPQSRHSDRRMDTRTGRMTDSGVLLRVANGVGVFAVLFASDCRVLYPLSPILPLSFRRAVSFIVPSIVANCKAAKLHSFVFLFRLGLDDSPLLRCCCCGCQQVTMVVAPCRFALRVGKLLLQYPSLPSLVQLLLRSHGLPLITTSNWFVSRSLACPSPLLASQVCH